MQIGLSGVGLRVGSQQRRNVAYSLHQIGLTMSAELSDHGLALLPISDRNLDFDQLMIIECAIKLSQNRRRQPFPGDGDDGLECEWACARSWRNSLLLGGVMEGSTVYHCTLCQV